MPFFNEGDEVQTRLDKPHTLALTQHKRAQQSPETGSILQVDRTHLSVDSLLGEKTLLEESAFPDLRRTFTTKQGGGEGGRRLCARAGTSACARERGI